MENFDIAKYLREHQLGSYGILNHYVDLKPVNENSDPTDDKLITSTKSPDKISAKLQKVGIKFQKRVDDPKGITKFYVKDASDLSKAKAAISSKIEEVYEESDLDTEIPYAGPDKKLTGMGEGDAFDQAETVSEDYDNITDDDDFYGGDSRAESLVNKLDLKKIAEAVVSIIEDLEADGYHPEEIQEFLIDKVREVCRPYMK